MHVKPAAGQFTCLMHPLCVRVDTEVSVWSSQKKSITDAVFLTVIILRPSFALDIKFTKDK